MLSTLICICVVHLETKSIAQGCQTGRAAAHHAMCYRGHGQAADAESGGESDEKLGIEH